MAGDWTDLPLSAKLYENTTETEIVRAQAALENAFVTESDGIRRFYGIASWLTLPDAGRVHGLHDDDKGNLIAVTDRGNVYRIDENANVSNVTGVPVSGPGRPIFAKTTDGLMIAAGGPIVRFKGATTDRLSEDAPDATHVQFIDNYLMANEDGTFLHSEAGVYTSWDPLDTFAANSKPDRVTSLLVTPFGEIMICGVSSIEQYERLQSGDAPFFRRWTAGEGVLEPYALLHADNALFSVNDKREVVRISGQTSQPVSLDIGRVLESTDIDWRGAWMGGFPDKPLHFDGRKIVLLQLPNATNPYGTKGLTYALDYQHQKWFTLYGWDESKALPTRWPGWCHWPLWGQAFVGGDDGKIGRLSTTTFSNFGQVQRLLLRTAHFSSLGEVRIDDLRMRLKRGAGSYTAEATIEVRVRRDNRHWGRWVARGLGKSGDTHMTLHFGPMGQGHAFQFEIRCSDDAPVEVQSAQVQASRIGY